jgi:hypothetical protein
MNIKAKDAHPGQFYANNEIGRVEPCGNYVRLYDTRVPAMLLDLLGANDEIQVQAHQLLDSGYLREVFGELGEGEM